MKFSDYILFDAINPKLKATDAQGVIREMVQSLVDAGGIAQEDYEAVVKTIIKREELGSTSIKGVAIPHTESHPSVKRTIGTVAINTDGIVFDSYKGEKVYHFFLILGASDFPGDFLRAVEHLTRRFRDDTFCRSLNQSKTREAIIALLEEDDSKEQR
jgi:PTS system fructose-specific IIA component/PTS system nitrogen regulatory IIA component